MGYTDPDEKSDYYYEWRKKRKAKAIELLGGKCIQCGRTEVLEFDHIDPDKKLYDVGAIMHRAWSVILEELDKCQLLCESCHYEKTKKERRVNG